MLFMHLNKTYFREGEGGSTLTEEYVRREAQKVADAIVAKKLKDMPTKEDKAAF